MNMTILFITDVFFIVWKYKKKIVNLGFGKDVNKGIYNEVLEFCYKLHFAENIENNIKKKLSIF